MKIVASIQARLGSSRLPGKVLADVCGRPMLAWHIERLRRSRLVDEVVVATSVSPLDDAIEAFCVAQGVACYRGPEQDVLARIAGLLTHRAVDVHVECYGDSPLTDPQLVDEFLGCFLKHRGTVEMVSSAIKTTYPPGQEVVVYAADTLLETNRLVAPDDPLREHVAFNITRFRERFRVLAMEAPPWFARPDLYLEVDTPNDLAVIQRVLAHFEAIGGRHFGLGQLLDLADLHPDWFDQNRHEERRWKAFRNDA